jgi:hypothetical protein
MMATASRTSYAAFFVAIGITIPLSAYLVRKLWKDKIIWAIKEYFLFGFISLIMLTAFGGSMYERLLQTLEAYPSVHSGYLFTVTKVSDASEIALEFVIPGKQEDAINDFYEKFLGKKSEPPENGLSLEEAAVLVSSDTQPTTAEDSTPSDVYVNVPVYETVATVSAEGVTSEILVERDRTYSENAQKYGLSMAIRLDTLWPRALEGFYSNPAFGSGYATLTKETYGQFTEAESTDNNFLRTLGETGALGFILFYGIIVLTTIIAFRLLKNSKLDSTAAIFVIAFIGGTVGLLLNALFIDVFAASKVALMYWALAGIVLAIQSMYGEEYFKFDFINRYFSQKDSTVEKVASSKSTPKRKKR